MYHTKKSHLIKHSCFGNWQTPNPSSVLQKLSALHISWDNPGNQWNSVAPNTLKLEIQNPCEQSEGNKRILNKWSCLKKCKQRPYLHQRSYKNIKCYRAWETSEQVSSLRAWWWSFNFTLMTSIFTVGNRILKLAAILCCEIKRI